VKAARSGFTVAEALVALLLGWGIVQVGLSVLAGQRRHRRTMVATSEWLAVRRIARHVLGEEARRTDGEPMWTASTDTVSLRAYRGYALICPGPLPASEVLVRAHGIRRADPAKDSVALLGGGPSLTLALLSRTAAGDSCPGVPAGPTERWRLSGEVPRGMALAKYFERGSYHLSTGALRYRRGAGGRQPLTPELLSTPPSSFQPRPEVMAVRLVQAVGWAGPAADTLRLVLPLRHSPHE